jgi:hypothetical protein
VTDLDRPLGVSVVLAAAIRIYGDRVATSIGLGVLMAVTIGLAGIAPFGVGYAVLVAAITVGFAVGARIVAGDGLGEVLGQAVRRLPVLGFLAFVVTVPFALALSYLVLVVVAIGWLAFTGFAIPAVMIEARRDTGVGFPEQIRRAIGRTVYLARAAYWHAVGVTAVLVILYLLVGILIATALVGFADNTQYVAVILAQLVLAPVFFYGFGVHFYEQRARASAERAPAVASPET